MSEAEALPQQVAKIEGRGITKRFPGVVANDRVTFQAATGEIHALLGENGSGKTTFCRVLAGLYRPDEGDVAIDGRPVRFHSPRDAYQAGVFMVQQHFSLVDRLTVAENVVLGWSRHKGFRFKAKEVEKEVAAASEEFHMPVQPSAYIWQLSLGERQRVEILKALYRGARVLILDEPTTVLTPQECETLFASLRGLAASGSAVIFISHKLWEVMAVCDRVTVLRQGRIVGTFHIKEDQIDPQGLAQLMVGRAVPAARRGPSRVGGDAPVVLEIDGLVVANDFGRVRVDGVSLGVRRGEIVGIAGVAGNGQRELAEAVTGLRARAAGTVAVGGHTLRSGDPLDAIEAGIAYIPEDRMGTGLSPRLRVTDNIVLKSYRRPDLSWGPFIRWKKAAALTTELLDRFNVKGRPNNTIRQLSGGNAQKVVLAREMSSNPAVLVVAAPTRGLDVSATESVRGLLVEAAIRGVGVLLISEDLDELLEFSDRVAVLYDGRIMGVVDREHVERDNIGLMMAGVESAS